MSLNIKYKEKMSKERNSTSLLAHKFSQAKLQRK